MSNRIKTYWRYHERDTWKSTPKPNNEVHCYSLISKTDMGGDEGQEVSLELVRAEASLEEE